MTRSIALLALATSVTALAVAAPAGAATGFGAQLNILQGLAIAGILFGAGSEIIALLPIRSNSWVQLALQIGRLVLGERKS
jgi:hypothetical protein